MNKATILTLVLMVLCVSLSAVNPDDSINPVRALGNNFSLLIPDVYEDTKTFPDRLSLQDHRFAHVATNMAEGQTAFYSISPFAGNFKSRHDILFEAFSYTNNDYDVTSNRRDIKYDIANYASLKLGVLSLGIQASQAHQDDDLDSFVESMQTSNGVVTERRKITNLGDDHRVYKYGFSSGLGRNNSFSIAYNYKGVEKDIHESRESSYITEYADDDFNSRYNEDYLSEYLDIDSHKLSLIKDIGGFGQTRILLEIELFEEDSRAYNSSYDRRIEEDEYNSYSNIEREYVVNAIESEGYALKLGYGSQKNINKIDLFYAGQLNYKTADVEGYKTYRANSIIDSVEIAMDPVTTEFDYTEEQGAISIPLGMSYRIKNWVRFSSSVTLVTEVINSDVDEYSNLDDLNFNTKVTQNIGWEFYPVKNLELGVYNMNDLSDYRNWELSVRYLF